MSAEGFPNKKIANKSALGACRDPRKELLHLGVHPPAELVPLDPLQRLVDVDAEEARHGLAEYLPLHLFAQRLDPVTLLPGLRDLPVPERLDGFLGERRDDL